MHSLFDPFTGKNNNDISISGDNAQIIQWSVSSTAGTRRARLSQCHLCCGVQEISMCSYPNILIVRFKEDSAGKNTEPLPTDVSSGFSE